MKEEILELMSKVLPKPEQCEPDEAFVDEVKRLLSFHMDQLVEEEELKGYILSHLNLTEGSVRITYSVNGNHWDTVNFKHIR